MKAYTNINNIMNKNLNLVEILKDCPNGMELDCTMFDNAKFIGVENCENPICIRVGNMYLHLTQYGTWNFDENAKCIIFPKGKTSWEGFVTPYKFNDGDIVAKNNGNCIGITSGGHIYSYIPTYCVLRNNSNFKLYFGGKELWKFDRLATEEERQKLFDAIKEIGYKWNAEKRTLEKLVESKFKVGDWIISSELGTARIIGVNDSNEYQLEYIDGKQIFSSIDYVNYTYDKWTIQDAKNGDVLATSSGPFIYNGKYDGSSCPGCYCGINTLGRFERCICETNWTSKKVYPATKEQRDALMKAMNYVGYKWNAETKTFKRLDKPKFDLKTLQPFDKVLVKVDSYWRIELFSNMYEYMDDIYYACARGSYKECIPYNDETKHLLGTSDEAPEYYRYWED